MLTYAIILLVIVASTYAAVIDRRQPTNILQPELNVKEETNKLEVNEVDNRREETGSNIKAGLEKGEYYELDEDLIDNKETNRDKKLDHVLMKYEETTYGRDKKLKAKLKPEIDNNSAGIWYASLETDGESERVKRQFNNEDEDENVPWIWDDCEGKLHFEFVDGYLRCVEGDGTPWFTDLDDRGAFDTLAKCPNGTRKVRLGSYLKCLKVNVGK